MQLPIGGRDSNGVGVAFAFLAISVFIFAVATNPLRSNDLVGRLASPAVQDRRIYSIWRREVASDGSASLDGTIPGNIVIKSMRWYVNGAPANIIALSYAQNRFSVHLKLPVPRDRWTVFAIADAGGFAHFVPMRYPIFLTPPASQLVPAAETISFSVGHSGQAQAALDYASGDPGNVALAGMPVLRWLSGSRITFVGWAIDTARKVAPRQILLGLDQSLFRATISMNRPDVAKVFGSVAYTRSGFTVTIPSTYVRPGLHRVTVFVLGRAGRLQPTGCSLTLAISAM